MPKAPEAMVTCKFCGKRFDRTRIFFCKPTARRYAHPKCAEEWCNKNNHEMFPVYDPSNTTSCVYCRETLKLDKDDVVQAYNIHWAHRDCQERENKREKTPMENLEELVKQLFSLAYMDPSITVEIDRYIKEGYTVEGIFWSLVYFYEVKHGDIEKANGHIGIVPYVYEQARKYYAEINRVRVANENVNLQEEKEKEVKTVSIAVPVRRKVGRHTDFFLEEDENAE